MKSEKGAIKKLTNNNSGVSCHYCVKRNGKIVKIVPDLYVAWHAGISSWKKDKLLNNNSIFNNYSTILSDKGLNI